MTVPDRAIAASNPELDLSTNDCRILTEVERRQVKEAFRKIMSTYDSNPYSATFENVSVDIAPFSGITSITLHRRIVESPPDLVLFRVYVDHSAIDQPVTTVADRAGETSHAPDCSKHPNPENDETEALGTLGEDWYDLERDLLELTATMVDLPAHIESWDDHVFKEELRFTAVNCGDQEIQFTFGFFPPEHVFAIYRDADTELAEEVGIPLEPSIDEMIDRDE
jgi:hypothetical protein